MRGVARPRIEKKRDGQGWLPEEVGRTLLALALTVSIIGFSQSLLFTALPLILQQSGLTTFQFATIMAVGSLLFLVGAPFWGRRSDAWGRRPVLAIGLLGFFVSNLIFAVALTLTARGILSSALCFYVLMASRVLNGLTASAIYPVAQACAADLSGTVARLRAMARLSAGISLGRVIGPGATMLAILIDPLAAVYLMALVALPVAFVLGWVHLPRVHRSLRPKTRALRLQDRRVWPFLLLALAITTAFGQVQYTIGVFLQARLGISGSEAGVALGLMMTLAAVAMAGVQLLVLNRTGRSWQTLLASGAGLFVVSCIGIVASHDLWAFTMALVALGVAMAVQVPAYGSALSLAVAPQEQGTAAGYQSMAQILGYAFGALLGGALYLVWPPLPFLSSAGIMLPVCVGAAWSRRRRGRRASCRPC